MTLVRFDLGQSADLLSPGEHRTGIRDELAMWEREKQRGIKPMRLPELQGAAVAGALLLGQGTGPVVGPRSGYIWSVMSLMVTGLTTGASPDVVNFYIDNPGSALWWQLNGNSPGVTFSKLQMVIEQGSTLLAANQGTFAATGTITVSGRIIEVPAEMIGKLA